MDGRDSRCQCECGMVRIVCSMMLKTVPCTAAFLYLFHRVLLSKWKLDYSFSAFVVNKAGLAKLEICNIVLN